jgi:hypothetical protein
VWTTPARSRPTPSSPPSTQEKGQRTPSADRRRERWWPPSGGRRRPPHETGTGGEGPDRAVLDPTGEHHKQSWTLALRIANADVTTRRFFLAFVTMRPACFEHDTPTIPWPNARGGPSATGRGASREVTGLPSVHSQSVAPVVRPGVDGSKRTALAWVLGLFSRDLSCADPDLRLSAMWFLRPFYSTASAWQHPPSRGGRKKLSSMVDIQHESCRSPHVCVRSTGPPGPRR